MKLLPLFIALLLMPFSISSATTYSTGVGTVDLMENVKITGQEAKMIILKPLKKQKKQLGINILASSVQKR